MKKYYINELMFLRKNSIMWAGQTKFSGPDRQASPTLSDTIDIHSFVSHFFILFIQLHA